MVETVNEANMRIGVCGHLGGGKEYLDGQTIKTKTIIEELQKIFFEDELIIVDTYGGLKHMFKHIVRLIIMIFKCDNVIILPAQNGLRVFAPIMNILNFRHRCSMHYIVIGGWLPVFLEGKPLLTKCLKRFDAVYVETKTMMHIMKEKGFRNIVLMKNFKKNTVLSVSDIKCKIDKPFELCMFSRVTPKKGIEDAINAIVEINDGFNDNVYSLTIYGQVDDSYNKKFTELIRSTPDYIKYGGAVDYRCSVETLKPYFALLFPTQYYTEGIPGTILDAYAAALPVISSKWESFYDVIVEKQTGFGYEFGDIESLKTLLNIISQKPEMIYSMKKNCLLKAEEYLPENAILPLVRRIKHVEKEK